MFLFLTLLACSGVPELEAAVEAAVPETDCSTATNTCTDYSVYWKASCPAGERCITFDNQCKEPVALSYQIGCNGDGTPGAPQCNCTDGSTLQTGDKTYFQITDAAYTSCLPSWTPSCLTAGLAVMANANTGSCTTGTRVEFTAGNNDDDYNHFDSYDVDTELGFGVPVSFDPDLTCATDHANHDCRPLVCADEKCPDAYSTPTTGGCPDGRSPQASCQDTFGKSDGFTVTYCPNPTPVSCQDATGCPIEAEAAPEVEPEIEP